LQDDDLPGHAPNDRFVALRFAWDVGPAPAGTYFCSVTKLAAWQGKAVIGGLCSRSLIRLRTVKPDHGLAWRAVHLNGIAQGGSLP